MQALIPYEEAEKVQNPCAVINIGGSNGNESPDYVGGKIVMYHNGQGPMCLEAMDFLETIDYPVEQHLTTEPGFYQDLGELKEVYNNSSGVSDSFGYYPIIFVKDRAFSGFNEQIKTEIQELID
jgi:hypothetical protein